MSHDNGKRAILLGLKPQGLFLLRELSRAGLDVHAIDSGTGLGFYSRYGSKRLVSGNGELSSVLMELHERFGSGTRCYISSGPLLDYVVEHLPQVYNMFEVYPRPLSAVATLSNKMRTYSLARELAIRCPESFGMEQVEPIVASLSSGDKLIAKWNREWRGTEVLPPKFKTMLLGSVEEFHSLRASLSEEEKQHLIVQRFIESEQDHNVSYLGYYVEGSCVAGFLAQQLRQFPLGITSYLKEYNGPNAGQVIGQACNLFGTVKYTGFGEAEFKFDKSFSTLYLLEVNPRTCGWTSVLKSKYPDLSRLFESPTCAAPLRGCEQMVEWCNVMRDMRGVVREFGRHKQIGRLLAGVSTWVKPKSIDVYDRKDMRPFVSQVVRFLPKRQSSRRQKWVQR